MNGSVHVRAPCRLHFGMFGFGQPNRPQFGGVGIMIDQPAVDLTLTPAEQFSAQGDHFQRVQQFVASIVAKWKLAKLPPCQITVSAPPDHIGLGVGTQLGLAVAAGVRSFLRLPPLPVEDLAESVGRGTRSAIGTYGFHGGGLIVDGGKRSLAQLGELISRRSVPENWRFVLVRRRNVGGGLAGWRETEAFAQLRPVPSTITAELWRIAEVDMLPALHRRDCDAFGSALYRFGRLAGECFATVQGGPFANPETESLVKAIRDFGVQGVGQSSWGPTLFALTATTGAAHELAGWLQGQPIGEELEIQIASPNNMGAQFNTRS